MGLLPLEFGDCLLDSPYFRENLKSHERQLEDTSNSIKDLISGIQNVIQAAKALTTAKRSLADTLANFQFDCIGTTLTDDEIIIASSLNQFSKFLTSMESEMNSILEQAETKFINPLINFRKNQIGSVKQSKKSFEKASAKLCAAQDRYISMSSKKEESLAELSDIVRQEQKSLHASSLDYVYNIHLVQEKKKFEFVEALLNFTKSWLNYYRVGNGVADDYGSYIADLGNRVEKTRDNFSSTVESYDNLKNKMNKNGEDPGLFNRMYTRQGYLYVQTKKSIKVVSGWNKYFAQYQGKTKTLTLIPYNQLVAKIGPGESLRVINCLCKDDISEKFRFSVTGHDISGGEQDANLVVTYVLQALSDQERKNWVEAMGGTWPAVNTLQRIKADSVEENINSSAYTFLKDCLQELEDRGLTEEGLYRVGGVMSKVKKLLNQAIDPGPEDSSIDLTDPKQWESKTLASAIKQYLRDLSKPVLTYQLYAGFIAAVKHENENLRINEIKLVVDKLPRANRELCRVIVNHLNKVSRRCDRNLMTASNLGVCFGPTLLRPREETVASIIDIKFSNQVVEILIENAELLFPDPASSPELDLRSVEVQTPGSSPHPLTRRSESSIQLGASWRSLSSKSSKPDSSPGSNHKFGLDSPGSKAGMESPGISRLESPGSRENGGLGSRENGGLGSRESGGGRTAGSVEPDSGLNTSSQSVNTTSSANKCKRTHSFSSLSELSVSSLPESYPTYRRTTPHPPPTVHLPDPGDSLGSDRPRSKSYQCDVAMLGVKVPIKPVSPTARSQADLLSSMEMMTLLAADLPLPPSPLRRSCTLLPSRIRRTPSREITRKPPLPKLMSVTSPTSPLPPFAFPEISSPEGEEGGRARPMDLPLKSSNAVPFLSPALDRRCSENNILDYRKQIDHQTFSNFLMSPSSSTSTTPTYTTFSTSTSTPTYTSNLPTYTSTLPSYSNSLERGRTTSFNDKTRNTMATLERGRTASPALERVGGLTSPTLERVGGLTSPTMERVGGLTSPTMERVGGLTSPTSGELNSPTLEVRGPKLGHREHSNSQISLSLSEGSEASVSKYENISTTNINNLNNNSNNNNDNNRKTSRDKSSSNNSKTVHQESQEKKANEGDGGVSPEVARVSDMASGVARVSDVSSGASRVSDMVSGRGPRRVYDRSIRDSGPYENVLTDTNSQQVSDIERDINELENIIKPTQPQPNKTTEKSPSRKTSNDLSLVKQESDMLGHVTRENKVMSLNKDTLGMDKKPKDVSRVPQNQSRDPRDTKDVTRGSNEVSRGNIDTPRGPLDVPREPQDVPRERKGRRFKDEGSWITDKPDLLCNPTGLHALKNLINSSQASNV